MLSSYQLYQYSQCSQFNSTARHFINYYFTVSICTVAVYYTLKYYMQGSLFFSKKLPCTMFWNAICTAVCYSLKILPCTILECYMHGRSIQFAVFKPLSYCSEETIGFDK